MIEKNKIYNESCIDTLAKMENESVDLIIADPPYFEIYGEFDFIFSSLEEYISWCKKWLTECNRVLKDTGSIYVWGKIGFNKGYPLFKIADWIENDNIFTVRNWITQRNTRGRGTKKGFMEAREELLFMTKTNNYTWNTSYLTEKSNRKDLGFDGKPRKNEFKRCSDVWIDITEASQSSKQRFKMSDGTSFPTVKALGLCDRIISASSNEGDLVYIPFAGSGSEIVSCINNQREYIASEINKQYIEEVINVRIHNII